MAVTAETIVVAAVVGQARSASPLIHALMPESNAGSRTLLIEGGHADLDILALGGVKDNVGVPGVAARGWAYSRPCAAAASAMICAAASVETGEKNDVAPLILGVV